MKKNATYILSSLFAILFVGGLLLTKYFKSSSNELKIIYPFSKALFPPEFPPPVFRWVDNIPEANQWMVSLSSKNSKSIVVDTVGEMSWQPLKSDWEAIKHAAKGEKIITTVVRIGRGEVKNKATKMHFRFSIDSVGAPILYREIPLPFALAEEKPDLMAYRLVDVSSEKPPHTVMGKFMVCGNCHSSSDNGVTIGLDFDASQRDKGGYFIEDIQDTIVFDTSNYLSWNKLQESNSFGMFSKLSPNGRYVATTIKDRVISQHFGYDTERVAFSQIFFPVSGVIAIYDRITGEIKELPGANLPDYVQSNAFWTPDGENILFVRAEALHDLGDPKEMVVKDRKVIEDFVERRREYKFDIYRVPFNDGRGGQAVPIKGASHNGLSNYFPAVSPDGKWLIFCQAENFMLLQPDSKLYIVPLEGGRAKALQSNLPLFNSWHAWAPNSKWTVFVSKGLSIYTDMFLTHIDDEGNASIPILLENARNQGRAANYPEFLNVPSNYTFNMVYNYVDIAHIRRAQIAGDKELAQKLYEQYVAQGQYKLASEYLFMAKYNLEQKNYDKAIEYIKVAVQKDPENDEATGIYQMIVR